MKQLTLLFFLIFSSYTFSQVEQVDMWKLYPTDNMYTFISLNTATGQMELIQWSLEDDNRFSYMLNLRNLVPDDEYENYDDLPPGRFKLYPTDNTYNFLLQDVTDSRTFQVQWSFNVGERFVIEIKPGAI